MIFNNLNVQVVPRWICRTREKEAVGIVDSAGFADDAKWMYMLSSLLKGILICICED